MLELIACLVITVYSFSYVNIDVDEDGFSVSFDKGCNSFSYVLGT
jgi:hypothetical protein